MSINNEKPVIVSKRQIFKKESVRFFFLYEIDCDSVKYWLMYRISHIKLHNET